MHRTEPVKTDIEHSILASFILSSLLATEFYSYLAVGLVFYPFLSSRYSYNFIV